MLKNLKLYYLFVSLPFILLLLGSVVFFGGIKSTITRNPHPQINYTIFVIILAGGVIILFNARRLMREARNLVDFSKALHGRIGLDAMQEKAEGYTGDLACILQMVAASGERAISHQEQAALEHELTNVNTSLNRRNALPSYLTGLLVGMGLLGTFIGLLATLGDISALISSFADKDITAANPIELFANMIEKMKAPMNSMAIAFSASMFGLLGSIILGLMMVGIRRLQGDITSTLSSEVARHIEIALSFETITYGSGVQHTGDVGDVARVLLRIEERFAETSRVQQRAFSSVIEDFQAQRADMLRTLNEQTAATNSFCRELQQLGGQLGSILTLMEKGNVDISAQLSELTVHATASSKETQKLLVMQVEEQRGIGTRLDSYKIEERLAEATRTQQRAYSTELEDFKKQRADMLRTLAEQTAASNSFSSELQQLGRKLDAITSTLGKGNDNISDQVSELRVNIAADAKQSHLLMTGANNTFRSEMQQLGHLINTLSDIVERNGSELSARISKLTDR